MGSMSLDEPAILILAQLLALAIPSLGLALVLRRAGAPGGRSGAAIAGGVIAGVLLGPGVLGSGWPQWNDHLFAGGANEAMALSELRREHARERSALRLADVSPVAMEELLARQRGEAAPLVDALTHARAQHRKRLDDLGLALIGLVMLGSGALVVPRRLAPHGRRVTRSVLAGAVGLALGVGVPSLFWRWLTGDSWTMALVLGMLVGGPATSAWLRSPLWALSALASAALLGLALALSSEATLLGILMPCALGVLIHRIAPPRVRVRIRRAGVLAVALLLPVATALLCVRFDLRSLAGDPTTRWAFWWGLVIALLWSSDGRMFAWMIALRATSLPARGARLWTPAARLVNCGVDVLTIALALVFARSEVASEAVLVSGVWAAALVTITPALRLSVSRWLDDSSARAERR